MKNKFHVSEIFYSIEGEGKRTGYLSVFIRLTGCNLRCSYCDTKYAQIQGKDDTEVLTEDEVIARVNSFKCRKVTLTGGEPLLHDVQSLVTKLSKLGYEVNIETNGAVPLLKERPANVFFTMDWKCPSSGENLKMLENSLFRLKSYDVLKFVVGNIEDLTEMKRIIHKYRGFYNRPLFYVSPVFGEIKPADIVEYIKQNKMTDVCVQVQLHKIIWNPNERGV